MKSVLRAVSRVVLGAAFLGSSALASAAPFNDYSNGNNMNDGAKGIYSLIDPLSKCPTL
ncbi:hypothetical protein [Halothiobacillus sp.]|uniref:hypothetical protein n=1 Tax=Halothiobacillus sp. TaxID=1891311 RepID=UPI0026156D99|nr:hypothetical protein [Halothiobacillus sp.]